MTETPQGTQRVIDGTRRVFYDGYWIKAYDAPADTLLAKKRLIEALTRRLFNHTEHGINIPGTRLDEARQAFDSETDPRRKRVKGAMLAGALFNRATDIFTKLVEIQALGVEIQSDNALMRRCGEHLQEALGLGKLVLHRSGDEGIDELWGEPFKAFAFPIEEFYKSRYIKIALTMRAIDQIADELCLTLASLPEFGGVTELVREFARAAKLKCETLRTDADIFDVWTSFAVSGEHLTAFTPQLSEVSKLVTEATKLGEPSKHLSESADLARRRVKKAMRLLHTGKELVCYIARARVPMPKSTQSFIERCARFRAELDSPRRSRLSDRPPSRSFAR